MHRRRRPTLPDAAAGRALCRRSTTVRKIPEPANRSFRASRGVRNRPGPAWSVRRRPRPACSSTSRTSSTASAAWDLAVVQLRQRHGPHRSDGRHDWVTRRRRITPRPFGAASRSSSITAGTIRHCSRPTARSISSRSRRPTAASRRRRISIACSWCRAWRTAAAASARRTSAPSASSFRRCATRRTISRPRWSSGSSTAAAGAVHRHEVHRQRGGDEDRAVHASGLSPSGRAALQGHGRPERRRELRVCSVA